ncbi:hypothetical protein [Burkholderia sp. Bp9143]|uniref:hypothetical protein n=1 Tax=Burkholderia sp. Bp9143 TaxID=2184574 RepID=UPI00162A5902|nr:hypothetical protein [Burkholderia sp. Bp9143]
MPAWLRGIVCRLLRNPRARKPAWRNIFNALIYKGFVSSAERVAAIGWPRFRNPPVGQAEISAKRPAGTGPGIGSRAISPHAIFFA